MPLGRAVLVEMNLVVVPATDVTPLLITTTSIPSREIPGAKHIFIFTECHSLLLLSATRRPVCRVVVIGDFVHHTVEDLN